VDADPDQALLIFEQVDVMIAGPHGSELLGRHFLQVSRSGLLPEWAVEELMFDALGVAASDAKADRSGDIVEDLPGIALHGCIRRVEAKGHVATGDVEPDTADGDVALISHYAAARLGIAQVGRRRRARRQRRFPPACSSASGRW
jgi:hypothetical protein